MKIELVPFDRRTGEAYAAVESNVGDRHWMLAAAEACNRRGLRPHELHAFARDTARIYAWAIVVRTSDQSATNATSEPLIKVAAAHRSEIGDDAWTRDTREFLEAAYLSTDNPYAGSGKGGGEAEWEAGRRVIAAAIPTPGTFLDTCCANGLLMESMAAWAGVEPYGLDISEHLVALARQRLPHWADRLWAGDARTWQPPRRFDYVYVLPEVTRPHLRAEMVAHLLENAVEPGGRLITGQYLSASNDDLDEPPIWEQRAAWGFDVAGTALKLRTPDPRGSRTEIAWITH